MKRKYNRNPIERLHSSAKTTAKRKGFEFTITRNDIVIPEFCPYLGIKLTYITGKGLVDSNVSIDRIDSTKGYVPGNI